MNSRTLGSRLVKSILLAGTCATVLAQQYQISTYAGTGTSGYSGDGGQAASAQLGLSINSGIAVDSAGNLYIAEHMYSSDFSTINNLVRKVSPAGIITIVAGTGTLGSSGDGGPATSAQLNSPAGLAVANDGTLYIAGLDNRIRKVSPSGIITTYAGTGAAGYSGDGGPAASAKLSGPTGLALDSSGNLYVADGNFVVRKISSSGVIITVAGTGNPGFSGDGGSAASARLQFLAGVTVDSGGNLYIADQGNRAIRKVTPGGTISTLATGFAFAGLAADGAGNLYVTDTGVYCVRNGSSVSCFYTTPSSRVRKISSAGAISTLAGTGTSGYSGDGGPATSAQLGRVVGGIVLDGAGNIYVEDNSNNVIRALKPTATQLSIATASPLAQATVGASYFQTLAASGGTPPYVWAIASGALPAGLALSGSGGISGTPTAAGTFSVAVRVTDSTSISVTQSFSLTVGPPTASIVNSASYAGGSVAPGELVVIFGYGMGPSTLAGLQLDSRGYVATNLAGTQVFFDGVPAPLIYTSAGQVSAVVPYSVSDKASTQIQVSYQGLNTAPATMPVTSTKPGIFTVDASGRGPGAILNQDQTLNTAANPASVGSVVVIFATGEGQTSPAGTDGKPGASPVPQPMAQPVTATIGGVNAPVLYAGGAPDLVAGVFQVNLKVPEGVATGNAVPVVLNIAGSTSQDNVTLAIR
jgi:uncharacterized protein (TIGR03437 family)